MDGKNPIIIAYEFDRKQKLSKIIYEKLHQSWMNLTSIVWEERERENRKSLKIKILNNCVGPKRDELMNDK